MNGENILDKFPTRTVPVSATFDNGNHEVCFAAIKEILFSDLNNEAVILSLKNGKYYGLNAVGIVIWKCVQESIAATDIEAFLMLEYAVDQETCRREVKSFLDRMVAEGLVERIEAHRN